MVTHILPVLESLCAAAQGELTINQLAKSLKKSYGYTNTRVHELAAQGILTKREVGSALLCSINYGTEETIGLLALSSMRRKKAYLQSLPEKERTAILATIAQPPTPAIALYLHKHRLTAIVGSDVERNERSEVRLVRTDEFGKELKSLDMKNVIVLQNHEAFWNAIAQHRSP